MPPRCCAGRHDWLILGMTDSAPRGWALFAITAPGPEGPWSERRLVRHVEADDYHPPLMEFFPAFVHKGFVYAPATSVALNRNFNAIFRADLEHADDPSAWRLSSHGSVWHAEDEEHEFFGIWGQTFAGTVDRKGILRVMFPSRDAQGRGTINLARRQWNKPLRRRGFVLTGHAGPSLTLLRRAYGDFQLDAELRLRGKAEILLDYAAPLTPDSPSSDATLHPLMRTRHAALEFSAGSWRLVRYDASGAETELASTLRPAPTDRPGAAPAAWKTTLRERERPPLWSGPLPADHLSGPEYWDCAWRQTPICGSGSSGFTARPGSARICFGAVEALLGAAEAAGDWEERRDPIFRFGTGVVSRKPAARVKWNVIGSRFALFSPRGPEFGTVEVSLDGRMVALLDLHADQPEESRVVWRSSKLRDDFHALTLTVKNGRMPVDSLEVR